MRNESFIDGKAPENRLLHVVLGDAVFSDFIHWKSGLSPPIKMYIHSLFVAVSLCEEDLALTIYYMTEEAGCSLPPTELSLCTCLGKLCRLTATQPHFLRTKTQ